jgi:hypothetical protein
MSRPHRAPTDPFAELVGRLLAVDEQTAELAFPDWSLRIPEPKRGTLDFGRFPYQRELYEQTAEEPAVVIKKGTQVGVSSHCIRWAMYWADRAGMTALYIFPFQRQLADFSATRVRALIGGSEYLRGRTAQTAVQNNMLMEIGRGHLMLRGSASAADLQSTDADVLVLDEYDLLTPENIPDAERRIGASELGYVRRVGVPSVPSFGIAELYDESDRRRWHVRCDACTEWQSLTFSDNVDSERLVRVCRSCRKPLDVTRGEWVAEEPGHAVRGYHVPRLIVPQLDVGSLVRYSRQTAPSQVQAFYNKELGEEHADGEARLTAGDIAAAQRPYSTPPFYEGGNVVTMGVDVATVRALRVRISEHLDGWKRALFIGTVDSFEALDELMRSYSVHMCAVDSMPEGRSSRGFAQRFPDRVYLVTYRVPSTYPAVQPHPQDQRVSVSRLEAIDATLEAIRQQRNQLPAQLPLDYPRHLQAAVRSASIDELGRRRVVYRKVGADDFLHAEVYDIVAADLCDYDDHLAALNEVTSVQPVFERPRFADYGPAPAYYAGGASDEEIGGYYHRSFDE